MEEGCKNDQVLIRSSTDHYQMVMVGCSSDRVFISDLDGSSFIKVCSVEVQKEEEVEDVSLRFELLEKYTNLRMINNGRRFRACGMQQWFKGCFAIDQKRFGRRVMILKLLNISHAALNHHLPWSSIREIEFFKKTNKEYHGFFVNLVDILLPTTPELFDSTMNEIYLVYDLPVDFTTLKELLSCSRRNVNFDRFLRDKFSRYCSSCSYTPSPSTRYINNRNRQALSNDRLCRDILTQLLLLLFYLKTRKVVNRNFIPDNFYLSPYNDRPLNWTTRLKLQMRNVGSSCHVKSAGRRRSILEKEIDLATMRNNIKTIYYGAPELMLGCQNYDHPSDMWSVGCIFAELLGCPHILFLGDSRKEQLNMITLILGDPRVEEVYDFMKSGDGDEGIIEWFKKFLLKRVEEGGGRPSTPLSELLPNAKPLALDLLEQMLVFNPTKRITVEAALDHPYIQDFLASDEVFRKKFMDLSSVHKKVVKEGKDKEGKDEEEEEGWDGGIPNHQLCRRMLMREKFLFYNREAIVKVHKKYPKAMFKGRFAT